MIKLTRKQILHVAGVLVGLMAVAAPSAAQTTQTPAKKASISRAIPEYNERRNIFAGNESRIAAMNYVNMDCTSGAVPAVRVVAQPSSGDLRLDEIKYPVERKKDDSRFHCNGKTVDAMGVFYKAKDGYTGPDKIVVDVDFRNGTVRRFIYSIEVR